MKKTQRRDLTKTLKRRGIRCQFCGQAPAIRYNRLGMAVCGKSHKPKKRRKKGFA